MAPAHSAAPEDAQARAERIDRLMDAIDLVRADRRGEARLLLRELIREDSDFEDAWLWMSVAVDSLDQAAICLDNVLRVNPRNGAAASALYHLRVPQMEMERRRMHLRIIRDFSQAALWCLVMLTLFGGLCTLFAGFSLLAS
jgi:hypothetical protein